MKLTRAWFNTVIGAAAIALSSLTLIVGCDDSARIASANISKAADNFEVQRRIVFYNGFTNEYMLTIEGLCSLDASDDRKINVICKVGPSEFKKHYLGLSDNVTYFIEQMDPVQASEYRYRVTFKPSVIVPDIRLQ